MSDKRVSEMTDDEIRQMAGGDAVDRAVFDTLRAAEEIAHQYDETDLANRIYAFGCSLGSKQVSGIG